MNSHKKFSVSSILILGLVAVGIISALRDSFWKIVILFGLIGLIFYLYKTPPIWLQRVTKHSPTPPKKKKRKQYPFKVIDGSKKKRKF